jgi:hypothetical protein
LINDTAIPYTTIKVHVKKVGGEGHLALLRKGLGAHYTIK